MTALLQKLYFLDRVAVWAGSAWGAIEGIASLPVFALCLEYCLVP